MEKESPEEQPKKVILEKDLDREAKEIAEAAIQLTTFGIDLQDLQVKPKSDKLVPAIASDIMVYAQEKLVVRTEQYRRQIDDLLGSLEELSKQVAQKKKEIESMSMSVQAFEQWLEKAVTNYSGPGGQSALELVKQQFQVMVSKKDPTKN